jgi:transcription antitermination protein NusB
VSDSPRIGSRREARETALGILYEADVREESVADALAHQVLDPPPYAATLLHGLADHLTDIDALLRRYARDWALERMAVIDRNVLRLAAYELAHRPDVPTGAVLSEAVELASRYSTAESGRFVNGVLAKVARELRPDDVVPEPAAAVELAEVVEPAAAIDAVDTTEVAEPDE